MSYNEITEKKVNPVRPNQEPAPEPQQSTSLKNDIGLDDRMIIGLQSYIYKITQAYHKQCENMGVFPSAQDLHYGDMLGQLIEQASQ